MSQRRESPTIQEWADENAPAGLWTGFATAWRAGARARFFAGKAECRYRRPDFVALYKAGWEAMATYLLAGGKLRCECCGSEIDPKSETPAET